VIQYVLRRILTTIPTLFLISVATFLVVHLIPGSPALVLAGEAATPQVVANLTKVYGLNRPLVVQYGAWLWQVLQGNLGYSYQDHLPVLSLLLQKIPVTLELSVLAVLISLLIAIPTGILSALRRGSAIDLGATLVALAGVSIPTFVVGILLILWLAVLWPVLPPSGYVSPLRSLAGNLSHMLLPAITLGAALAALNMRLIRSSLIEILRSDFVRTAFAKGLPKARVVWHHAMKNAAIPVVTVAGLQLGTLLGGAVLTEQVFNIPGFGQLLINAIYSRDYPTLQGAVLFAALAVVVVNLVVDLLYALLDPRIRLRP
jgi:peptide/nickel transport system permease protein